MKTIIFLLLMVSTAIGSPCDDDRERFERAKKFGATDFKCKDHYNGTATSSFSMTSKNYKKFIALEIERKRQMIKGKKKN